MSRLGGAGAVAQLVADVPLSAVEVINTRKLFEMLLFFFFFSFIPFLSFQSTFTLFSSSTTCKFLYHGTYLNRDMR